jgi:hypothetical protein
MTNLTLPFLEVDKETRKVARSNMEELTSGVRHTEVSLIETTAHFFRHRSRVDASGASIGSEMLTTQM